MGTLLKAAAGGIRRPHGQLVPTRGIDSRELMDLRMPVMDGVEATRRIMANADAAGTDRPRIIAVTTFNREQAVIDAVQPGPSGYLLKSSEPESLLPAIRAVHSGYSVTGLSWRPVATYLERDPHGQQLGASGERHPGTAQEAPEREPGPPVCSP